MFLKFFGKDRDPATLSQRDWDRFIRDRRSGRVGPSGKPVSDRTIERDLRFLLAVVDHPAERTFSHLSSRSQVPYRMGVGEEMKDVGHTADQS